MYFLIDKPIQKFEEDAVSPPSSPTPGLKIIQGKFNLIIIYNVLNDVIT